MKIILIVEDEPAIVEALAYNLEKNLYQTYVAYDGGTALEMARDLKPDLILLDIMLPGMDGIEVCKILRQESNVPIIMLTAKDEEIDRVLGLEIGADDYVVKPFSMRELMARVKSVLRRVEGIDPLTVKKIEINGLTIDPGKHLVVYLDKEVPLSTLEFDLLHCLARHPDQVLHRDQLLDLVWGYNYFAELRVVDSAIKRLRRKLRDSSFPANEAISTVRGLGYKLNTRV